LRRILEIDVILRPEQLDRPGLARKRNSLLYFGVEPHILVEAAQRYQRAIDRASKPLRHHFAARDLIGLQNVSSSSVTWNGGMMIERRRTAGST
jgi:hypothetical protein